MTATTLPVAVYCGTKESLIADGIVTEKMLHLEEVDNGFGITTDEYGNDVTIVENYDGLGGYQVTKYLVGGDSAVPSDVDVSGIVDVVRKRGAMEGLNKGALRSRSA